MLWLVSKENQLGYSYEIGYSLSKVIAALRIACNPTRGIWTSCSMYILTQRKTPNVLNAYVYDIQWAESSSTCPIWSHLMQHWLLSRGSESGHGDPGGWQSPPSPAGVSRLSSPVENVFIRLAVASCQHSSGEHRRLTNCVRMKAPGRMKTFTCFLWPMLRL